MQALNQRNQYLDYTKGILIILVLYGHIIQYIQYNQDGFFEDKIFKTIYIFHMPLFMGISGFLSFQSIQKNTFSSIVNKRCWNLVVPIISWSTLYASIYFLLGVIKKGETSSLSFLLQDIALNAIDKFWFLWALFFSILLVSSLKSIEKDNVYGLVLMFFAVLLLPDKGNVYLFQYTFPFFCIGYLVARNKMCLKFTGRKKKIILLSSFIFAIISYVAWNTQTYIYVSRMSNLYSILLRYFAGVVFCIFTMYLFYKFYHFSHINLRNFLCRIGKGSLYIYILQTYFFIYAPKFQHLFNNSFVLTSIIYPVLAILLAICFTEVGNLSKHNTLVAKLLFGRA
jgi:fucose 4-O-acetylase-like acetyltransferase